jgi:hypothetical protein
MRLFLAVSTIFVFVSVALAQDADTVNPDRPSTSSSTHVVPAHHVQLEGGIDRIRIGSGSAYAVGEVLVRVGITKRVEAGIGVPSYLSFRVPSTHWTGADDTSIDTKIQLMSRDRVAFGVLAAAILPTGSRNVAEHTFQPSATFLSDFKVSEVIGVTANATYSRSTDVGVRFNDFTGVVTVNYSVSSGWSAFTEVYGSNNHNGFAPRYAGAGVTKTVRKHTAIDASGGVGLGNDVHGPDYYWGFGVSHLF